MNRERRRREALYLSLYREFYDQIECGEKVKEYRDRSPFWDSRLENTDYERVVFRNGYHKDARKMSWSIKKITKTKDMWVIHLGERLG